MKVPAVFDQEKDYWLVSSDSLLATDVTRLRLVNATEGTAWKPTHPLTFALAQAQYQTETLDFEILPLTIEWHAVMLLNMYDDVIPKLSREHWGWCSEKRVLVTRDWLVMSSEESEFLFLQRGQFRETRWESFLELGFCDYGNNAVMLYNYKAFDTAERLIAQHTRSRNLLWQLFDGKDVNE